VAADLEVEVGGSPVGRRLQEIVDVHCGPPSRSGPVRAKHRDRTRRGQGGTGTKK
jgi:hypothetical protein